MGKITKAIKEVTEGARALEKVTHDVSGAAKKAEQALQRTTKDAGSAAKSAEKVAKPEGPATKPMSGPVTVKIPSGASPEEVTQFERYADGSNRAIAAGALSPTGRVASTKNGVRRQATDAAKAERARAKAAGAPYQGVAGHVPDAAWMGKGEPYEWQDMAGRVNSSLAGQINRYPVGYKPTRFEVEHPPDS